MRIREEGACHAYQKGGGGSWSLPRSEFPRLKQEWMAGRAFFEGLGFYGATVVIKLGDIVGISDATAEQIMARIADDISAKKEDDAAEAMP